MKIVKLSARDVLRLTAVEIEPSGNVVTLGGKNGAGKSAVLDSIALALGGKKATPAVPIRQGAKQAKVVLDLGDLIVERVITQGADRLLVKSKDGAALKSPQAALDKIVGAIAFDPLSFSRMSAREQSTVLRTLVGLDTSKADAERERLFNERTLVNRNVAAGQARVAGMPRHTDAPTAAVSVADLTKELERRRSVNDDIAAKRRRVDDSKRACDLATAEVARMHKQLEIATTLMKQAEETLRVAEREVASLADLDLTEIRERISGAETENRRYRENVAFQAEQAELMTHIDSARKLSERLERLDREKVESLSRCKFPVSGLGLGSDGDVTFNDLPFAQASSAEKLRVSVAMACAANPELRVFFVRDGSLLDPDGLRLIAEMAKERDAQVWIEDARTESAEAIIIEDGHVQEAKP